MNQKKAKALRRAVASNVSVGLLPKMAQTVDYPVYGWVNLENPARREFRQVGTKPVKIPVNHYRNAKRAYLAGHDAYPAVTVFAARRHALAMEAIGVYIRMK